MDPRIRILRIAAAIGISVAPTAALGVEKPPAALIKARAAFAAAVGAKNFPAVATLTDFPLEVAVYRLPPTISRSAFPGFIKANGYEAMADCLASAPLEPAKPKNGVWLIDCHGNLFYFALHNGAWRHSKYENINE